MQERWLIAERGKSRVRKEEKRKETDSGTEDLDEGSREERDEDATAANSETRCSGGLQIDEMSLCDFDEIERAKTYRGRRRL